MKLLLAKKQPVHIQIGRGANSKEKTLYCKISVYPLAEFQHFGRDLNLYDDRNYFLKALHLLLCSAWLGN
jgi:hypothetical protein